MRALVTRLRANVRESGEHRQASAELQIELVEAQLDGVERMTTAQIESAEKVAAAADQQASRLVFATWALVGMTAALVIATVVLIVVTATN
jgi:hypothetical protein